MSILPNEQQQLRHLNLQISRRLRACLALAEQHFNRTFAMPEFNFNLRGVKAGVAYLQQNEIRLNRTLLLENSEEFLRQVVPHELAHLIVYQVFGRVQPHGKEWQFVMQHLFKLPADTCHQFDVQRVQGKTVAYRCDCQTHQLSVRRHNNILRNKVRYHCRVCKGVLLEEDAKKLVR
ncbi:SprT family zinc-dependent metalloprotease [Testudinibacter aquarius]|uniref:Protein SprT n=1 Tax=Testudinibacter aquarius TaxID=1524974 RepID=A0A4R3YDF8_9PAST|nr:SprT family zinc-dependent metalloprotease [Testudinibacter aquarius]KAE9529382.1 SprT family protein [Testudinibacter aquarius]TCV89872.1 SprT protein [Testudinibacter aquarius]TNG93754.1 SprT family zinc-dependent metalloprotease [Testudinibacter aquarius]